MQFDLKQQFLVLTPTRVLLVTNVTHHNKWLVTYDDINNADEVN